MNPKRFQNLIRTCIKEVLDEGRVICAWCKKDLGDTPTERNNHTICPDCKKEMDKEYAQWKMGQDNDKAMKQAGSKFV